MLIFLMLGIFLFPKINADEIKIEENGSVHWIREWKEEHQVAVNTEMKYIIDSPLSTTIGRLEKETKLEGCQHIGGCKIIMTFGDGVIFYEETIETSIDKIEIDLGKILTVSWLKDNFLTTVFLAEVPQIQERKMKSCESFLIHIMLGLPRYTMRRCSRAYTETYYNIENERTGMYYLYINIY